MPRNLSRLFLTLGLAVTSLAALADPPAADVPFRQEYHERYPLPGEANDVRSVAVDPSGVVWAATRVGVYVMATGTKEWHRAIPETEAGPSFKVFVDDSGTVWAGTWNGVWHGKAAPLGLVPGTGDTPVSAITQEGGLLRFFGPAAQWRYDGTILHDEVLQTASSVRALLPAAEGGLWVCTGQGLYRLHDDGYDRYLGMDEIVSAATWDAAYTNEGSLWVGGLGGITVYRGGRRTGEIIPEDGLPNIFVQAVEKGPDGRMWVGTTLGVTRFDGERWSLRHSKRWLLDDDVRDIAFDAAGTAWIATAGGVSAIKSTSVKMADKAEYFGVLAASRHTRPPGFVEKVRLKTPGDYESWEPEDDDNDGEYTSMFVVAESYRYAVTKDPNARESAKKAFAALRYLQTVTETPGFIARTVIPTHWDRMHDGNRTYSARERAAELVGDPRYKPVEQRWRPTPDGKWLWKGDTSSDEITGHFYAFGYYYDLAADDAEKEIVRTHVRNVMDYIIDHGYVLMDIDGKHTRWGVWAPERLNNDPNWSAERGINSAEILAYLKTAHHITGDEKYQKEYLRLLNEKGYRENVRRAKAFEPAWCTHIDDELLALVWPGLLRYETDPELRKVYLEGMKRWYEPLQKDKSPFFNFTYAELTGKPDKNLDDSLFFLRDAPLDLINWTVDNSEREDVKLVRSPSIDFWQTKRVLPPSERSVVRWDKNPFEATSGDDANTAWAPTFYLLPYWQGRYLGLIAAPEATK